MFFCGFDEGAACVEFIEANEKGLIRLTGLVELNW